MVQEEETGVQDEETDSRQILETHPPGNHEPGNNFGITNGTICADQLNVKRFSIQFVLF